MSDEDEGASVATTPLEGSALQTFKERNEALQHLVRELVFLREWNKSHKPGDPQGDLLMFAEGAVGMLAMEHFLRAILGDQATDKDTFRTLLEKATSKRAALLVLPWDDQEDGRKKLTAIRNTLMHGNFAQAATEARCSSVREYFQKQYAGEIEKTFHILDDLMKQIDPATGRRYAPIPGVR
jgi:hypothetical protein